MPLIPVSALLGEALAVWNMTTLKTTGQQRVAVLVTDIGEVLACHAYARRPGLLQTIHKVPFLFRHRTLLVSSSYVLHTVRRPLQWVTCKKSEQGPSHAFQPISVLLKRRIKPPYQRPEVLGVIGMDQVAQLMDHHIVSNGMRCLDDVPVEEQLTSGIT